MKFCCAELVGELDTIRRMVEGEQYQAALGYIDTLGGQYPGRSCLEVIKATVHLAIGQFEPAEKTLRALLQRTPDNVLALSHWAVAIGHEQGPEAAVEPLQRALELSASDKLLVELAEAIATVGTMFASAGNLPAAQGHWLLRSRINPPDNDVLRLLADVQRSTQLPLPLRDDVTFSPPPDGAEWAEAYTEAVATAQRGLWRKACDQFAAITSTAPNAPQLWRALAKLRSWLGDTAGYVAVMRRLASLDVPIDDAVEAEMLAQLFDTEPSADELDQVTLCFTIRDIDAVTDQLARDERPVLSKVDPRSFRQNEDEPPPRSVYTLLDRAMPEAATAAGTDITGEDINEDDLSSVLGLVSVYGRETNREPRLELRGYRDATLDAASAIVREIVGDQIDGEPTETIDGSMPSETALLRCTWQFPEGTPFDRRRDLQTTFRQRAYLQKWPDRPLRRLDGKTPREAATDPAYKIRVMARLNILEVSEQQTDGDIDFNQLRDDLGLPKPEPIDPTVHNPLTIPLVRLARVDMDKLDPEQSIAMLYRLLATNGHAGLRRLIPVLIERDAFGNAEKDSLTKILSLAEAYGLMADLAGRSPLSLAFLEKARQAADDAGESNATVDIQELTVRIEREEVAEFSRLVDHLLSTHGNEKGVRETIFSLLTRLGLITADGRPVAPSTGAPEETTAAAASTGGKESGIWTPESEQPGGGKSLWLPGSD
jgi:hypothetical protein